LCVGIRVLYYSNFVSSVEDDQRWQQSFNQLADERGERLHTVLYSISDPSRASEDHAVNREDLVEWDLRLIVGDFDVIRVQ